MSVIPLELIVEMGKYDLELYTKTRMLSKWCHKELCKFNPVGHFIHSHTTEDRYWVKRRKDPIYRSITYYCESRVLTPTGFKYKECRWRKDTHYNFENFLKTTLRNLTDTIDYKVIYSRVDGWVEFHYDMKDRICSRSYYTTKPPTDSDRWRIEYLWPTTGNIRIKSLDRYASRSAYELRRPNGTLKYTERRHEWKRYSREYYDKTGAMVVATCDYEIINGKRVCINRTIKGGWH
ncbi:hypothetical protein F-VV10_0447 [Faustovirus]|nr:hypothetical protein F-VV10_0447 [Faustovirus]